MVRKYRGITDISEMEVAQVGVRIRARALAMVSAGSASNKRRKASNGEIQISTSNFQIGSTTSGGLVIKHENSATSAAVEVFRCRSPSSDHASISYCLSNGSSERIKTVDPEDEKAGVETLTTHYSNAERETKPMSEFQEELGDLDSMAKQQVDNKPSTAGKMPPESELEEFFAQAEKKLKQEFTEKYNFDVEKGEAMVGRYEWVKVEN